MITLVSQADTDAAVASAAFPAWAVTAPEARAVFIRRIIDWFEEHRREPGESISMEMGAPIDLACGDHAECPCLARPGLPRRVPRDRTVRHMGPKAPGTMIAQEAIGVVGLIPPWNWPIWQLALKVVPALLAGGTCVLKPSEESPLSALVLAHMCHEAGLPPGVPEYNYGMSGVLKNALDWASRPYGRTTIAGKLVLTLTSSPAFTGGVRAQAQLNEILVAISAQLVLRPQAVVAAAHQKIKDGKMTDEPTLSFLSDGVDDLIASIRHKAPAILQET